MERIELKITQETDYGIIKVSAERNGSPIFIETFSSKLSPHLIHTLSTEEIEGRENAITSVSDELITSMLGDIRMSEKTSSKALYGQSQSKFELTSLIDIRNFEKLSGVRFDYSKFNNLIEFQRYFKSLLK